MPQPLWVPDEARIRDSRLAAFMDEAFAAVDYSSLWQWSVSQRSSFWAAVWDFCGVKGCKGESVLQEGDDQLATRFFPQARLNYAENLLFPASCPSAETIAITYHAENGAVRHWTYTQLRQCVSRLQQALKAEGVEPGDRVAGIMPNMPETVAMMLATASIGAVWSSASPDFGVQALTDRLGQTQPCVIFVVDRYDYNGKNHSCIEKIGELKAALSPATRFVTVPFERPFEQSEDGLQAFLAPWSEAEITFLPMRFDAPLFILFSSGTTGLPKCIVHSVGGALLQHLKEHQLQSDIRPGDTLFYYTTCGWMMWNWQVSALASGARLVLFDGAPFYPDGSRLAEICATEKVSHFGTSAKYLESCAKAGIRPGRRLELDALRVILSTGSPLAAECFRYVYENWKSDLCLSSIAGGTDILGCFVGGSPISPVFAGECQQRQLGMDVAVFDETGQPAPLGGQGELVCRKAHPSMPLGFLNDPDKVRYQATYFTRFPGAWHQGDLVSLSNTGGVTYYGRSDSTLNPGGVRIGTGEIYRVVNAVPGVYDSVVVGRSMQNDVQVLLFVQMDESAQLDDEMIAEIRKRIRINASPRHIPAEIFAVPEIPYTKTGKLSELAVRDIVNGKMPENTSALRNPEALDHYRVAQVML